MSDLSAIVWAYGTEADLSRRSLAAKGSLLCVNFLLYCFLVRICRPRYSIA
jgi:hypothetical protein